MALLCATENELTLGDAEALLNRCIAVAEAANIPFTLDAANRFREAKIPFAPGKAANVAGFVKIAEAMLSYGVI